MSRKVLITDFDGTMTDHDFYKLVRERLFPPGTPDPWDDYRAGKTTHFEALNAVFARARPGEEGLIAVAQSMGLDPDLKSALSALEASGWEVAVASAGSRWYIDRLLAGAGASLPVTANPGSVKEGRLVMELDRASPHFDADKGVNKVGVVRAALATTPTVAYAGDSLPDLEASLLVPDSLRFATGVLAEELNRRGTPFRPFQRWAEVARALVAEGGSVERPSPPGR